MGKKILLGILVLVALFTITGCGKGEDVDFNKTKTITFHDLTVEIPEVFTIDNENSDNVMQFYNYNDDEKYNSCMLDLSISNYPKSDMKESIQEGFYDKIDWSYSEKNINGNKWFIGYREESVKYNQTYYVINKNGKKYALNYDDFGSGEKCAEALKIIEKSLNFK